MITLDTNNMTILKQIPVIDSKYYLPELKNKSVVVLGSSKSSAQIDKYLSACSDITKYFVENDFNIISGCSTKGIMGAAYNTAYKYSKIDKNNRPAQNLCIITEPLWGDENLKDCVIIGKAGCEADRIEKFSKVSNKFVIFPGSAGSIQEAATLVAKNVYGSENKKLALYGKDFWKNFENMFKSIVNFGLLKKPLSEIFKIVNTKEELIKFFLKK